MKALHPGAPQLTNTPRVTGTTRAVTLEPPSIPLVTTIRIIEMLFNMNYGHLTYSGYSGVVLIRV